MVIVCEDVTNGVENMRIPASNDCDDEIPESITYVKTNIPGPTARLEDFEALLDGCNDTESCSSNVCHCIQTSRGPTYNSNGRLAEQLLQSHRIQKPIVECNSRCICATTSCPNRIVQRGVLVGLTVFKTENKGWALRTEESFVPRGTFVCEYAGEILGYDEARDRTRRQDRLNLTNYVHVLREHLSSGRLIQTCVDPSKIGNVGRYVNHSCEPNLVMVPVRAEHLVPRMCLFAAKDIYAGEELTFDYSGGEGVAEEKEKCTASNRKKCHCGSVKCRRYLPCDESIFD